MTETQGTGGRPPLTIDMVSDYVCPWCYVGFASLGWSIMALSFERALEVRYRPYRLRPETPPGGVDRAAALAAKFPDPAEREAMREHLDQAAQDAGLAFDPSAPERLPDTTDAHRVTRWAHEDGLQREVAQRLFEGYWRDGLDIGRAEVLGVLAGEAGMDAAAVEARLATGEDRADVAEEAAAFRQGGVDGVPTFIVDEETGFAGALPKARLLDALRQLSQP